MGIANGAALVFFAYIGFDAVSTAAEEAINPQRDSAIGILGSLLICTIAYIAVSGLLTAIVPYSTLNVKSPVAETLLNSGYPFCWRDRCLWCYSRTHFGCPHFPFMRFPGSFMLFLAMDYCLHFSQRYTTKQEKPP